MAFLTKPVQSKLYVSSSSTASPKSQHVQIIEDYEADHRLEILFPTCISDSFFILFLLMSTLSILIKAI
ncbi:hypothetical protein C2G38_2077073 [Gigaspora rosea]|uniref:Uncharacterized protein n=1 Tax=Gigaspora rosea TaxID=44941 RepID=A0A397VHC4_9GLOM|nr:hypothetical protein C2G38_2077073 [Gigaspora rosea]